MSDNDAERPEVRASIEEALDLLGLRGGATTVGSSFRDPGGRSPGHSSTPRPAYHDGVVTAEMLHDPDGVRRLHVHGCGRQSVRLSRSRCHAMLRAWEQLVDFALMGGRPGTALTEQVAVRDVNGVIVVEIGGEIGRPLRFTSEKLAKLLAAEAQIRQFAGFGGL